MPVLHDRAKLEEAIRELRRMADGVDGTIVRYSGTGLARAARVVIDAAEAHLATLPKTQAVWRVAYAYRNSHAKSWHPQTATHVSEGDAERAVAGFQADPGQYGCISLTGPHFQEVPA